MAARCQSPWACRSYKWCSRRWMERRREGLGHRRSCTVLERYIHIHITYSGKIYDVKAAHSKPNDLITWIFKRPRQTGWLCLQVLYPCAQKCCRTESDTATWMDKQSHFRNTATERSVLNYSRHVLRHWRNTATNTKTQQRVDLNTHSMSWDTEGRQHTCPRSMKLHHKFAALPVHKYGDWRKAVQWNLGHPDGW